MVDHVIKLIDNDIKQLINYGNNQQYKNTVLQSFKVVPNSDISMQKKVYQYIIKSIMKIKKLNYERNIINHIITFYIKLIESMSPLNDFFIPSFIPETSILMFFKLGKGVSSIVKLSIDLDTMKKYAIKHINYSIMSDVMKSYIQNEIEIMRACNHPNIIKCDKILYTFLNQSLDIKTNELKESKIPLNTDELFILMKNADYGDCFSFMRFLNFSKKNNIKINPSSFIENFIFFSSIVEEDVYSNIPLYGIHKLLNQLIDSFIYLEDNNMMHRDIKPSNILVIRDKNDDDFPFSFLLCDFTMAKKLTNKEEELQSTVGTLLFMSPEKLKKQKYDNKSESWSLGTTLSIFYFGSLPSSHKKNINDDMIKKFVNDNIYQVKEKTKELHPIIESFYIDHLQKTLINLLKTDKKQRMTIKELKLSPFVNIDIQGFLSSSYEKKYNALLNFMDNYGSFIHLQTGSSQQLNSPFPYKNQINVSLESNSLDSSFLRNIHHLEDENKKLKIKLNEIEKKLREYKSQNELIQNLYNYDKLFS